MSKLKSLITRAAVGAAAFTLTCVAADTAAAVSFIGRDVPTTATISPGATGPVPFTYRNTGDLGIFPPSGSSFTFTAPGNTTFAAPQTSVPGQYSADGTNYISNNLALRNCVLSNGNTTMTCEGFGISGGDSSWPSGSYFRFAPNVTVNANAPAGTTLSPAGTARVTYNDTRAGQLTITDGTLNVATPAPTGGRAGMCLDATNGRANGTKVRIWQCINHTNQRFVIDGGQIKVADTIGTSSEQCVSTGSTRNNGDAVILWQCQAAGQSGARNQQWVVRGGQIVLKDTIGTAREMCLDVTTSRANNVDTIIYQCGATNTNQFFVVQRGYIKVEDTL